LRTAQKIGILQDIYRFRQMNSFHNLLNVVEIEIIENQFLNMFPTLKFVEHEKHFDQQSSLRDICLACTKFLKTQKRNPCSFFKEDDMINVIIHKFRFDDNNQLCDSGNMFANPNYMINNWDYLQIIINRPNFLKRWKNEMGMNALHVAMINQNHIIAMFLITIGVNMNEKDIHDRMPFEYLDLSKLPFDRSLSSKEN